MKRYVKGSNEYEALMGTMRDNVDKQNDAKVGMFWYNPERNRLVGVRSAFAGELPFNDKGRKTLRALHHTEWPKVREDAIANGSNDKIWDEEDYTQVPRGRVFQMEMPNSDDMYFQILVGSWLDDYPQAAKLIINEFNLDGTNYDFVESSHWDIGKGTSELFI